MLRVKFGAFEILNIFARTAKSRIKYLYRRANYNKISENNKFTKICIESEKCSNRNVFRPKFCDTLGRASQQRQNNVKSV